MAAADVSQALAMGRLGGGDDDPLGLAETLELAAVVPGLHAIGVADPRRTEPEHLRRVEGELAAGRVVALKGYLGYLHFGPSDPGYRPYLELAERFKLPFIFHTGDTYSPSAKLRFAQPLLIDDVAVDHPNVRFVMAHLGNPWLIDAAQVIYKNINVWADLSGLAIGGDETFSTEGRNDSLSDLRAQVRRAFRYAERPNRFLFGSDWPLAPIAAYAAFVASAIPADCHEPVFRENASRLFRLT
jgi:predicted TIM-barrel fold metal-dependent hydrolase